MKKILFIFLPVVIILICFVLLPFPVSKKRPDNSDILFKKAALQVHTRWEKGDDEGRWRSGELVCDGILGKAGRAETNYLQCNPNFVVCWYRRYQEIVHDQGKKHIFQVEFPTGKGLPFQRGGRHVSSPLWGILRNGDKEVKFSLSDTCREVYLPEGYYGYGIYSSPRKDWRWDNFGRNIFVDKYLVSNRDVWEWLHSSDYLQKYKVEMVTDMNRFPEPAVMLTFRQMQDYCSYQGKQLIEAHVFDAATFYPGDISNLTPEVNVRGKYPWSRMSSVENEEGLKKCLYFTGEECLENPGYTYFSNRSMSWIGISQVLGGLFKAQRNPIHKGRNLLASSFYYPVDSDVHQLGFRVHWDGQGHAYRNFKFRGHSPKNKESFFKIGFRCMRDLPRNQQGQPVKVFRVSNKKEFDSSPLLKKMGEITSIRYDERILGKRLQRPQGTWYRLFEAKYKGRKWCLFYRTPNQKNGVASGELRWGDRCESAYLNKILVEGISHLKIEAYRFETVLYFKRERSIQWILPHFNIQTDRFYQRYDSPVKKSYRTGLSIGQWVDETQKIGKLRDRYGKGSATICHQVNENCQNVIENICDQCRFGHFEVVDFRCPQGGSKYCGQSHCGERNEPACLRGFRANQVTSKRCEDHSMAGFCQQGLHLECDSNGILMCSL